MKNFLLFIIFCFISLKSMASLITLDTSNWSKELGPSNSRNTGEWVGVNSNTPEKKGNSSGALISENSLFGNFIFSGFITPTSMDYDDNDIIGIVFGWQDASNHYRLGWTQTQTVGVDDRSYKDITGRSGLFLIQEVNGLSNTLFNISDWFWSDDTTYSFQVSRQGETLNIGFGEKTFSVDNRENLDGKVGIYTESQTAKFSQLKVSTPDNITVKVPEPTTLVIFSLGILGLIMRKSL